ncbi:SDR family oxidoreductase [Aspergillus fijiensis CBS 313.89]|uniref:Short chain oxidoreductase n=1 Tax=Aspergillus fijiensis CBS 313.89 TaxID=1448319 RepID=A0A8G1RLI0_9EURO|nr:short chain oxidoreductase [Aspergillus fijiensis CBS 313.89]RAK72681.1 short chain oxidoreductase [Aspergillus fijiensis CBS 313.89]
MSSYLITGTSRGIGLELVRQLVDKPKEEVGVIFASARSPNNPKLDELLQQHPGRIVYVPLDVTDEQSVRNASQLVQTALKGKKLDVLINNAGVMKYGPIEQMDDLEESFRVNVAGVHYVTRAFLPLMRDGEIKKVLNISTSLGSITRQPIYKESFVPSYKVTKAALNMLTVAYSQELDKEGFTVFCISPGWLRTDLGSQNADLPVATGVGAVLDVLWKTGREGNGRFFNVHVPGWENNPGMNQYDGKELPW